MVVDDDSSLLLNTILHVTIEKKCRTFLTPISGSPDYEEWIVDRAAVDCGSGSSAEESDNDRPLSVAIINQAFDQTDDYMLMLITERMGMKLSQNQDTF